MTTPSVGFSGMSHWEKTPGQTLNLMEGLCIFSCMECLEFFYEKMESFSRGRGGRGFSSGPVDSPT